MPILSRLEQDFLDRMRNTPLPVAIEPMPPSERGEGLQPDGAFTTPGHEHDAAIRGQDWRDRT